MTLRSRSMKIQFQVLISRDRFNDGAILRLVVTSEGIYKAMLKMPGFDSWSVQYFL